MDFAKLKTILMFVLSLLGFGTAGLNGGQIAWQGFEGDIAQWILTAVGGGGGLLTLLMGMSWFKKLGPPTVEISFLAVATLAKYFETDPGELEALNRMARKLGEARIKPLPKSEADSKLAIQVKELETKLAVAMFGRPMPQPSNAELSA